MIGDISNKVGGETDKILEAIGSDSRIGDKYSKMGLRLWWTMFPKRQ